MAISKGDLVSYIAQGTSLTKANAQKALEAALKGIEESLQKGEDVRLIGFGSFSVSKIPARDGVNPRTGEKLKIAARNRPVFKAGKELKDAVNSSESA